MSRTTSDDQLKFLLSCVKHSNNGKIDFVEVASECGIVSKGAAAKRYERLMKANGIHPSGGSVDKPAGPAVPRVRSKAEIAKAAAAKRRKIESDRDDVGADDEDDLATPIKPEQKLEVFEGSLIKREHFPPYPVAFAPQYLSPPRPPNAVVNFLPTTMDMASLPPTPQYVTLNGSSMFNELHTSELSSGMVDTKLLTEEYALKSAPPTQVEEYTDVSQSTVQLLEKGRNPSDCILILD